MRLRSLLLVLGLLVVGTACSGSNRLRYSSAKDAYQKGYAQYQAGDYEDAIRFFRAVFQYGRGNEWADDAQYFLASSYREQSRYLMAATEYGRFLQLYPTNQRAPHAEYQRALAYYERSPNFHLGQSDSYQAISYFQLFLSRYPNHELAPKAEDKIFELRTKLAHKQYAAGALYEERELWPAAVHAYKSVFDEYPDTPWADDALLASINAYIQYSDNSIQQKQAERYQAALDQYRRLTQLFPDSPLLDEAEALYQEAQRKLQAVQAQQQEAKKQSLADTSGLPQRK
ncbi:outer membrane protein assembly factor BamD [Salisaeta longa]|uniref:outer membrane protein assembly factor BamD n=1 Tax=Salisaeta longa TaxID=503170 RepID=UPI0003B4816D|nr:outer membrane protein assembly factor BamD [Salisaeta longa]